ncbi:MAG TPA: hypothetical protein ACFCUC_14000 [Desulfobacterales bacterium]
MDKSTAQSLNFEELKLRLRGKSGTMLEHRSGRYPHMVRFEEYSTYDEIFEYHGGTTIQRTRKKLGETVWQDWLMFDSVEAAIEYFNNCCEA